MGRAQGPKGLPLIPYELLQVDRSLKPASEAGSERVGREAGDTRIKWRLPCHLSYSTLGP